MENTLFWQLTSCNHFIFLFLTGNSSRPAAKVPLAYAATSVLVSCEYSGPLIGENAATLIEPFDCLIVVITFLKASGFFKVIYNVLKDVGNASTRRK